MDPQFLVYILLATLHLLTVVAATALLFPLGKMIRESQEWPERIICAIMTLLMMGIVYVSFRVFYH